MKTGRGGSLDGGETAGELTPLQLRFAEEYAAFPNGTKAAIAAGYSHRSAAAIASELLRLPKILARIREHRAPHVAALEITTARTIAEIACIAYCDATMVAQVCDGYAFIADTSQLPKHIRPAIASIHQSETGIRIKLHDKVAALRLLAEIQGLFKPKDSEEAAPLVSINGVVMDDEPPRPQMLEHAAAISPAAAEPKSLAPLDGIILPHNPTTIIQPPPLARARIEAERAEAERLQQEADRAAVMGQDAPVFAPLPRVPLA